MSGISFQFGANCVIPLLDAATDTPIEFMYAPGANTRPFLELLTAEQEFRMVIGSFYVETDGRHILIDPGQGLPTSLPSYGHMMENFERAGLENEKITDVVFTHLHLDHIGWASHEGKSVFPNATYWVHQADMEYFVDSQNESISGPDIIQADDRALGNRNYPDAAYQYALQFHRLETAVCPHGRRNSGVGVFLASAENSPRDDKKVTEEELAHITSSQLMATQGTETKKAAPWKTILNKNIIIVTVFGLLISFSTIGMTWVWYGAGVILGINSVTTSLMYSCATVLVVLCGFIHGSVIFCLCSAIAVLVIQLFAARANVLKQQE